MQILARTDIIPPTNPIHIKVNGYIVDWTLKRFINKYLPGYEIVYTSRYRDPDKNIAAGGASDSAHLYNLAIDFHLLDREGNLITDEWLKNLYDTVIKPNWTHGFSQFEYPNRDDSTAHIHINLDRSKTKLGIVISVVGVGLIAYIGYKFLNAT